MRFVLFLVLSLLLTCCGGTNLDTHYQPSQKSMLVDEISNKVFKQLKTEKKLYPIVCTGRMMDQITLLHWGFFYYKEVGIDEARELLITIGNQFLRAFNADERIHPFLAIYPFTQKNIQVEIFLKKPDGRELEPEKLHVLSMSEGILKYKIENAETGNLETVHTETYEEATAKLVVAKN